MKQIYSLLLALCLAPLANAQYCTPSCTNPTGGCTYGRIDTFSVSGASGTSLVDVLGCTGSGYENRTTVTSLRSCVLNPGGTYTVRWGNTYASNHYSQAWIDYDTSGTFDTSEVIGGGNAWRANLSNTFTVPSSATPGTYRLRFINEYGSTRSYYPAMLPCMGSAYSMGDARDYEITISTGSSSSGCSGTPSGGSASAAASTPMCGYSVVNLSVSGASTGTGYTYMWYASTDGGSTWTVASSSASYSTATVAYPSVSTLYRCTVTCAAAGTSANSSSASVTVDKVHGHISFSGTAPDTVSLKVWLVQYNRSAGTLIAVDSTTTCLDSMNAYYSFSGVRADSYLVKAKSLDVTSSIPGSSGYVPTYGASSAHWSGATLVGHASGTTNTQDINMVYGTVTAGPGFVGGLITSGAGKGTAADIPAADMLVFLKNASTGVITQAYTNASGNYSFSSIATGTYFIYPEVMGFATTPSATITLTSSASSFTNINFRQYNDTKRILPFTAGVANVNEANSVVGIYPNPTNGNITLSWNGASGNADVTVADVTGRIVFRTTQVLGTVAGESTIQLPANLAGMYIVKVAGTGFAYTTRLTVQH